EKREAERIQAEEAEQQPTEEIILEAEDEESPAFTMSM
ncbi:MAG: virulence associated protein, partial [Clostridiales bacterium]|nr:virulence associated protein [Clostridiales bacterium]